MSDQNNRELLAYLREHTDDMVEGLKTLIDLESPTLHKPSVDKLGQYLADRLRDLGGAVEIIPKVEVGDVVRARWNPSGGGVVILSHMDTVWDMGTVPGRPTRVDGNLIYGVGAMDMKGGIVIALWALRALRELGLFPDKPVTYMLNSDEETGSRHSGAEIESEALSHDVVFVTEAAARWQIQNPAQRQPAASPSPLKAARRIPAPIMPAASMPLRRWRIRS